MEIVSNEKANNGKYWQNTLSELLNIIIKYLAQSVNTPFFESASAVPLQRLIKLYKSKIGLEKKTSIRRVVDLSDSDDYEGHKSE